MDATQKTAVHEAVFWRADLYSKDERRENMELIEQAAGLSGAEVDTLYALFRHGPLFDGDVPSKTGRNGLVERELACKVVVSGEDGFNACTQRGAWAYRVRAKMKELGVL